MTPAEPEVKLHAAILAALPPQLVGLTVLDVGAGMGSYLPSVAARCSRIVLLDAYQPYLDRWATGGGAVRIVGRVQDVLPLFGQDVFDAALAIDFIEHLDRGDAASVLEHMQRIAGRVVLFVPEGPHPQEADALGLGGDVWQTHRSTWYAADLEALGFRVERWPDFHKYAGHGKAEGALWCVFP